MALATHSDNPEYRQKLKQKLANDKKNEDVPITRYKNYKSKIQKTLGNNPQMIHWKASRLGKDTKIRMYAQKAQNE